MTRKINGNRTFRQISEDRPEEIKGLLRITTTDFMVTHVLSAMVAGMRADFPETQIKLISTYERMDLAALEAEVGVRMARSLPEGLVGEKVGRIRLRVMGRADYFEKNSSDRYSDHAWLGVTDVLYKSPPYEWQKRLDPGSMITRTDSLLTNAALALNGVGIAMIPTLAGEGLVEAPMFDDEIFDNVWVCTGNDVADVQRIQAAKRWLIDTLSSDPRFAEE